MSLPTSNRKLENTSFKHTYYSAVTDGNNIWLVRLFVEEAIPQKGGEPFTRGYELKEIEKIGEIAEGVLLSNESLTQAKSPITLNSISDLFNIVKQFDKNFNPLPVSRELLNEDGTPKVVYHRTDKGGLPSKPMSLLPGFIKIPNGVSLSPMPAPLCFVSKTVKSSPV